MKKTIFAAAIAALTLGMAMPAAAQDYRDGRGGGYNDGRGYNDGYDRDGYGRNDFRGRGQINIRSNDGRYFSFDRRDRNFDMFVNRPYAFRPGLTYVYSNRCDRRGCLVTVFSQRDRRPVDRFMAPQLPRWMDANWRQHDGRDGRWDSRRDDWGRDGGWDERARDRQYEDDGHYRGEDRNGRDGRDGRGRGDLLGAPSQHR
ncbi:hypothetical protein [Terricaulis sp.]|uniref:hypothetical protein n=1 Tax=Terricaulis sp. TaxID=2768686 RepID=UPI003782FE8A